MVIDMAGILLIDDAQITRTLLRMMLEENGYTVCGEAANGIDGLKQYRDLRPDLVFCDIMMNEMNGMECMQAILDEDTNATVVICTSAGDEIHIKEALDAGAKEFITKPVKAVEVIRIAEKFMGKPVTKRISYKELMEKRAAEAGVDGKPLLDFFAAFRQYSGFGFSDPRVTEQYLRENGAGITIGVRALLSAKMSTEQVNKIMDVFGRLTY